MRILVVSQYFWPENFRINDLVREFDKKGHQVTVLTGIPNYPGGKVFPAFARDPQRFRRLGDAVIERVPMLPRGAGAARLILNYVSFAISASLLGAWRLRGERFDAVFVFEPSPITVGLPAALLGRLKKAPVSFWVLDLWPETLRAIGVVKSPRALWMVGKLVSFIYARCELILAQSRSFVPQIRRYCDASKQVVYFPSWSDTEFDFNSVDAAPEVQRASGEFTVMFAGNIGEAQDFPAIIAAAERARDRPIRWLIVGDGRAAAWARNEVLTRGLERSVIFLGQHPVERMPSFFKHADALLVSLKDEEIFSMTIPGKLQAYLAAGLPILGMLNGEGAAIIEEARAGFAVPAGDGIALADQAMRLADIDEGARSEMGRRGRAYYEENFDREMLIGRLATWLQEISSGKPATGRVGGAS